MFELFVQQTFSSAPFLLPIHFHKRLDFDEVFMQLLGKLGMILAIDGFKLRDSMNHSNMVALLTVALLKFQD